MLRHVSPKQNKTKMKVRITISCEVETEATLKELREDGGELAFEEVNVASQYDHDNSNFSVTVEEIPSPMTPSV